MIENVTFLHKSSWTQSGEYYHIFSNILFKNTYNLFRGRIVAKLILAFLLKIRIISKCKSIEICVVSVKTHFKYLQNS